MESLNKQVGGSHYVDLSSQPAEYILDNNLEKFEGDVVQYVTRWKKKNGLEDLKKAVQCLQIICDYYTARPEKLKAVIEKANTDSHSQAVNAARQAQEQAQKQKAKQDAESVKA